MAGKNWLLLLLLVASACEGYDVQPASCTLICRGDDDCPRGLSCSNGKCGVQMCPIAPVRPVDAGAVDGARAPGR